VKASFAADGTMLNAALVVLFSVPDEATTVYPLPALLIDRLGKLATPFAGFTVVTPASVPPPGFAPMATVTALVALGTVLPEASWIATTTAGVIAAPTVASLGCTVKKSFAAEGGWVGSPQVIPAAPTRRATITARERTEE
jgi:hypothetical protein